MFKLYMACRKKYVKDDHHLDDDLDENELKVKLQKPKKSFVGTVYYIAPEMLVKQDVDPGCDLWALGIIIYKLYTGEYLFNQANDYLIFQEIKNGKYKMSDKVPEEAKDLISNLLRPKPEDRLGNGKQGSGREMKDLKNHKFFDGIDFENFLDIKSPIQIVKEIDNDVEEISSEEELIGMRGKDGDKKIILSGLVKKMKYVLMYNTRQLILYSNGILEYFDPEKSIFKGDIKLDSSCKVFAKGPYIFHLQRPEREYIF